MQLLTNTHTFPYTFEETIVAVWQKYPNDMSEHVKCIDILDRKYNKEEKKITTHRLITCQQKIPTWLQYIIGKELTKSKVLEISELDYKNKQFSLKSLNITGGKFLKVYEEVVYKPNMAGNTTEFKQNAYILGNTNFNKINSKIEDWSISRFNFNAARGKKGFESILELLFGTRENN
ncbi:hypothetical protein FOG51_03411 [Hanseniaspora uvarum]|uniref:Protein UPS2, mitochondrial n=1 Tax=Hanseniaspora uvarum TaxID=29833 RepID=A0A1E5R738_HANUV|nr:hypothetical protein FOG48_02490 [Hanseniaspora uvarum]KKA01576.1 Protein UPS3, mitochondrial [Hanseniaspora uvarum DSM 2768]KAF0272030.1 hypothetical protein FOG51_03411 [Hanseniaspora uvarum]KAF0278644.1 hypothetical protein FOG50_00452 [Hanseniaspora uvarum]OEJ82715.1 Protein UPS2, mitochondrial [Hanseniaspora uvarum]